MTSLPAMTDSRFSENPWQGLVVPPSWAAISPILPNTEAWRAERERRIGASEASVIIGAPDAYEDESSLWRRKCGFDVGGLKLDPLRIGFGHAAEVVVSDVLQQQSGAPVIPGPWLIDLETPLSGSVDLVTIWKGGRAFVEVKITWERTNPYSNGGTPDRTLIQQVIYAAMGGFEVAILAVVVNEGFGPRLDLREEDVLPSHHRTVNVIRERVAEWYDTHVVGLLPPPTARAADWARYAVEIQGLRAEREATMQEESAAEDLMAIRAECLRLDKEKERAASKLAALTSGQPVRGATWRAAPTMRKAYSVQVAESTNYGVWAAKPKTAKP